MEQFVDSFPTMEAKLTGEEIHKRLDEIEEIHGLYSPVKLGFAAALASVQSISVVTEYHEFKNVRKKP